MPENTDKIPPGVSLAAGMVAGGLEGFITYPTEFVKTQLQLPNSRFKSPFQVLSVTVHEKGFFGIYRGLSALVVGNAAKAGVRFLAFDQLKLFFTPFFPNDRGLCMIASGLGAGIAEAIMVVTPSETIKTKLIHDANSHNPKYRGMAHGIKTIVSEEGIKGIYRGLTAVVARQGSNSAVRMSCYGLIREKLSVSYPKDAKGKPIVPWFVTFFSGSLAGTITVYATMPLDVVKTRLQSMDASGSIISNMNKVVKSDGFFALWKGATPRLGRLIFSGGIVFTLYESIISLYLEL